ncbi:MAG: HAMP domain-containing histidine kinase [Saprospiraceae bacterium]|nr:HAMP domain-containing histidine kinase [Saprospiraceae bacterium]
MGKWWKDPIVLLMEISFVLLVSLGGVWLVNSYQREYHQVIREGEYIFTNTLRSLEDSLLEENFGKHIYLQPDSLRQMFRDFRERSDSSHAIMLQIESRDSIHEQDSAYASYPISRRIHRKFREHRDDRFVGSLAMQLMISRNNTISIKTDQDSLASAVFALINNGVATAFDKSGFYHAYTIRKSANIEDLGQQTKPFFDMWTGILYALEVQPEAGFVLMKIFNQIIFVLLTLTLTLLAFIFSYRTLQKQRRLTLLKNDLISNISHELKTPIATVKVALEALENFKAGEDSQKRKEYLEISKNELERLALLVDKVLKSTINDKKEVLHFEKISLIDLAENILKTMRLQFEKYNAQIQFIHPVSSAYILGDRLHLTSVLYNILDNALKYSDGKPVINVELKQSADAVSLHVKDHGRGVPKLYLSKIFEKFFRVPEGDVHNTKGHGLGLSYVADVMHQHQGSVQVESRPGEGSTFVLNFPRIHE